MNTIVFTTAALLSLYLTEQDFRERFCKAHLELGMAEPLGAEIGECSLDILICDILNVVNAVHQDDGILNRTHSTCEQKEKSWSLGKYFRSSLG